MDTDKRHTLERGVTAVSILNNTSTIYDSSGSFDKHLADFESTTLEDSEMVELKQ